MNSVYFQTAFASSAHTLKQLPMDAVAEVAFAGRSNAGKSSAINAITRKRSLARTSKTPGRTQLINHFVVEPGRYIVDLPGYGYAKVSKSQLKHWRGTLSRFLEQRDTLRCLVIVMDIRHPLTDTDWQMIELQQRGAAELHLLLTKADKLSRNQQQQTLQSASKQLTEAGVEATLQTFSALKEQGVDDAHEVLDAYLFDHRLQIPDSPDPG
ncbi:MAG: ribosome biogenesis GTP-binding protein YihA/YsxC [Gammaproteobacteria bacterium]|nr:ribosome biogenesis GTP-binding protein YihA/YsxC [Gammaproteobacteria bacterium]